ncbi:recombinase family protein [Streptomyces sp. NPDC052127]|uniref:recombinase family protein n=1 Tax=Streptomyces sp. NPDC052127 TaxID=3155679 RepID=UPI003435B49E
MAAGAARPRLSAGSRPPGRRPDQWPDARIRSELEARFGTPVPTGEIVDRQSVPLRSVVFDLMSHGRLHLLGDAAHLVPPTSAKGIHLTLHETDVMSGSCSTSMSRPKLGKAAITPGGLAAIYRRVSHTRDEDQTGVDRQERLCWDIAERLQLRVEPTHVYMDNNRSAWQRNRKRPGVGGNAEGDGGRRDPARHRLPPRPPHAARDGRAIVEEEAEIVREVCRRYLDGDSPSRIAQDLAARDIPTSKGKTWNPESVRHLLSSPVRCRGRPPADEEGQRIRHRPGGDQAEPARLASQASFSTGVLPKTHGGELSRLGALHLGTVTT